MPPAEVEFVHQLVVFVHQAFVNQAIAARSTINQHIVTLSLNGHIVDPRWGVMHDIGPEGQVFTLWGN
jgi:hypothetical protein